MKRPWPWLRLEMLGTWFCLFILLAPMVGCSSSGGVSGTVTYDGGKPVTGGHLVFNPADPAAGGSATGIVEGGNFKAAKVPVGKCTLLFVPPSDDYPEGFVRKASVPPPESPFKHLVVKEVNVEVKAGENTINVELVIKK